MVRIKPLLAAFAAAMMALGAFGADKTAKAVYEDNRQTLKFVYDSNSYGTKGSDWFSVAESDAGNDSSWAPWNAARTTVTKVIFDYSFRDYKPTRCSMWFHSFNLLTSVVGTEYLDISEAQGFRSMFEGCSSLESLDLSRCKTGNAKATTMFRMFSGCSNLQVVRLGCLCTENVTDMQYMFAACDNLRKIFASDDFVTASANGSNMFYGCENLFGGKTTAFDSNFRGKERACIDRPGKPGYFTAEPCAKVVPSADEKTLRFTYDTADYGARGTDWFSVASACEIPHMTVKPWRNGYYSTVTNVIFESNFYDFHPRTCDGWFYDFSHVVAFEGLRYLNVSESTTLADLFRGCSAVKTLDLSTFNTAKVTSIAAMFNGCSSLETIYASSGFTTSQIAGNDSDVFYGCSSSLVGGNGTHYSSTSGAYARIDRPNFPGYFTQMEKTAKVVVEDSGRTLRFVYDLEDHGTVRTDWFPLWDEEARDPGASVGWNGLRSTVTKVVFDDSFASYRPRHCGSWFNGFDRLTKIEGIDNLDTSEAISFNFMFERCSRLTKLDLSRLDTRSLTSMSHMFAYCTGLEEVNLAHFDTAKVTAMNQVFSGCTSLETIYVLDDFDTSALLDYTSGFFMFENCGSLVGGNGTSCNVLMENSTYAKVDREGVMGFFTLAPTAKAVPSADRKTLRFVYDNLDYGTQGTDWYSVDETCALPVQSDVTWYPERFYVHTVVFEKNFWDYLPTSCERWFRNFGQLETIEGLRNLNVSRVTRFNHMFIGCYSLRILDLSRFNTARATSMNYMFSGCTSLTTIYASENFVVTNLATPGETVFDDLPNLVGGNGTSYATAKRDSSYAHIDQQFAPGYFTRKPTAKAVLMGNGTSLTFVYDNKAYNYSGWQVFEAPDEDWNNLFPSWYDAAYGVTEVTFESSFLDYRPESCRFWFYNFENLSRIKGIENLVTSKVTDMSYMFYHCSSLTSLDLGRFDTSKVTDMDAMFDGCSSLETIYATGAFTTDALDRTFNNMFDGCSRLVGGNGTAYAERQEDGATMARVDDPAGAGGAGYFTLAKYPMAVYNTAAQTLTFVYDNVDRRLMPGVKAFSVKDAESRPDEPYALPTDYMPWWTDCRQATKVVFDASFAAYRPAKCSRWFEDFKALETVEGLENLDVSAATSLYQMFYKCEKLAELDLSSFNTANVAEMYQMFYNCEKLTTVYVGNSFSTAGLSSSQNEMFSGCTRIVGGNGTRYSANNVGATYARVDAANTPGYFSRKPVKEAVAVYSSSGETLTFYYDELDHQAGLGDGDVVYSVSEAESIAWNAVVPWYDNSGSITKVVFDSSFSDYRPRNCRSWFFDFGNLEEIAGMENLNTSEVVDMKEMFMQCSVLEAIDLSHFNTSNVTNMNSMFSCCTMIGTLDVSSFDTRKVRDMTSMFYNCWYLTTIYAYEFSTAGVYGTDRGANMFTDSDQLVGGSGTRYSSDHVDYTYARNDLPATEFFSATPGYFTYKAPAGGYAAWAEEQGLVGDDADWDAKPAAWGGEWANAFIYTFGEGLLDGTTILLSISFDADGHPVITTAPVEPGHDDFDFIVVGTIDLSDWSVPVELERNGNDWTLPPGISANFFRIRFPE